MNKVKPRFKRFEMHGNLPAALLHGIVVSASKPKEVDINHANRTNPRTHRRALTGAQ